MSETTSNIIVQNLNFNPYRKPVISTRKGAIFNVHPYPTKINYKSIVPFILAHTRPSDTVYDCFAGTCSTGIAAASCVEKDDVILSYLGENFIQNAEWGPRRAICVDIGVLPTFIGSTLVTPVDSNKLKDVFNEWIAGVEKEWGWLYKTKDDVGNAGVIRYIYFSDIVICSECNNEFPYIEVFVDFEKGKFNEYSNCPKCDFILDSKNIEPVMENVKDKLLKKDVSRIKRIPYMVYGNTDNKKWKRRANTQDLEEIHKIREVPLPSTLKPIPMMRNDEKRWGEMYRSGYHRDVTHVHHFYSDRNLTAVSILFHEAKKIPEKFRNPILLSISSYNVANSTLMTRFVFKEGSNRPVNTSAQPGVLYIPNCQVEKNVFGGVKRKFSDVSKAIRKISKWKPNVEVKTIPAQDSQIPSGSIDYIITDPPFGKNIQYSELNFLSEAWIGNYTENDYETVISNHQNKDVLDYEKLLTEAFNENYRVLKPGKFMTVIFHNTSKKVWNALQRAIINSGFQIVDTSILDKTQTSFKQTTTQGAVKKDLIILAWKVINNNNNNKTRKNLNPEEFIKYTLRSAEENSTERTFDLLFGRYVGHRLLSGESVPVDAKEFKKILEKIAEKRSIHWYIRD